MKNRMLYKKLGICAICGILCASTALPVTAMAQGNGDIEAEQLTGEEDSQQNQNIKSDRSEKEEVVYGNLNSNGTLSEACVVNIFNVKNGQIVDYGDYEAVKNLTSTEEIRQSGEAVLVSTNAERFYYEGTMRSAELPWLFDIHYFLEGKEYGAEEIAGKSGALRITISIKQNPACQTDFFETYALQLSLSLDTKKAENITAEGAARANVGSSCQLTYTILPGKEKDITVTADVTDFEMDAISANGIPLSLDIDVDEDELMAQITELVNGIEAVDDGASEVSAGAGQVSHKVNSEVKSGIKALDNAAKAIESGALYLVNGGNDVNNGAYALKSGVDELDSGVQSLKESILQSQQGMERLDAQSDKLTDSSASVKKGISNLNNGLSALQDSVGAEAYKELMGENGLDIDTLQAKNQSTIASLSDQIAALNAQTETVSGQIEAISTQMTALENQAAQLEDEEQKAVLLAQKQTLEEQSALLQQQRKLLTEQMASLQGIVALLTGNSAAISGTESYLDTVSDKLAELSEGSAALGEGYEGLDEGIRGYTDGVSSLADGSSGLTDGVNALADGSNKVKTGVSSLYSGTDQLLNGITAFYDASGSLKDGTGQLDEGVAQLLIGLEALYSGADRLKDGTGQIREETAGMDSEISEQIDGLLETISGGTEKRESFVSDKNTNVSAVQFVIKAEGVSMPEPEETVETETEKMSFWQKLLALFHFR